MKKYKYIFLIVGFLILFLLFRSFGLKATLYHIWKLGYVFWLIILMFFVSHILLTYAWRKVISFPVLPSDFYKLVLARIAGDATSSINGIGAIAGEPLKAIYVRGIIPFNTGMASVVLDRIVHSLAGISIMITGICVGFFILDIPSYISIIALAVILSGLILFFLLLKKQHKTLVKYLLNFMPQMLLDKFMTDARWNAVKNLDDEIAYIFSSRKTLIDFYTAFIIKYFSILISCTLEIYLIIKFINIMPGFSIADAMFVYVFGFILTSAIFFIPANVGTSEGSYSLALKLLGFDPALGLSIGIIRRLRTFVWAAIGILILFHAGLLNKDKSKITGHSSTGSENGTEGSGHQH